MKHFLLSVLAFLVAYSSGDAKADSIYTKMQNLYSQGGNPKVADVKNDEAVAGKCVDPSNPMTFRPGAIFFHSERDEALGNLFYMVPFTKLEVSELTYGNVQQRALDAIHEGKMTSTVSANANAAGWAITMSEGDSNINFQMVETQGASGMPTFVLVEYDSDYSSPVYCYFADVLTPTSTPPENVVVPPPSKD